MLFRSVVDLDESGTIEMTVKRGGEKLKRTLTLQTYTDGNGAEVTVMASGITACSLTSL